MALIKEWTSFYSSSWISCGQEGERWRKGKVFTFFLSMCAGFLSFPRERERERERKREREAPSDACACIFLEWMERVSKRNCGCRGSGRRGINYKVLLVSLGGIHQFVFTLYLLQHLVQSQSYSAVQPFVVDLLVNSTPARLLYALTFYYILPPFPLPHSASLSPSVGTCGLLRLRESWKMSALEQERDPFTDLRRLLQSSDLTLTGMLSDLD